MKTNWRIYLQKKKTPTITPNKHIQLKSVLEENVFDQSSSEESNLQEYNIYKIQINKIFQFGSNEIEELFIRETMKHKTTIDMMK